MEYDSNGCLLSVTSTNQATDKDTYNGYRLLTKRETAGSGTYYYTYADPNNAYRVSSVTNNLITESFSYNTTGNLLSTTISGSDGSQIVTSSTYSTDKNRVATVTDAAGSTVSYQYGTENSKMLGLPTAVTAPNGVTTNTAYDVYGRVTQTSVASLATLQYTYSSGNLTAITRTANEKSQTFDLTYDAFGNTTSIGVGYRTLAAYTYGTGNGLLTSQTYGNGDQVTFTYDDLGRTKTVAYSDGLALTYTYTGDGQLHSIASVEDGQETKYLYNYDSLGRLIYSERKDGDTTVLQARQGYDDVGRLVTRSWQLGSSTYSESFTYNSTQDGSLNTHTTATGQTLTYGYDGLRRLSTITGGIYSKTYTYRNISTTQTTNQVATLTYDLPTDLSFGYTYDNMGNITAYTDANGTVTYTYDSLGQLTKAVGSTTYSYTYDNAGNLLTAHNSTGSHTYTYGDPDWCDLLTAYDGETITYDANGNPTSYYNGIRWTFTWEHGRSLGTASNGTNTYTYTYNADGLRTSKTVLGVLRKFYYVGGKLTRETWGSHTVNYFYDAEGKPYAMEHNGSMYYYVLNLQGDVIKMLDPSGAIVANYTYDAYGRVLSASGTMAGVNSIRYRGYYYDGETGLYYCQSRYYDPQIGRFINADAYASTGQGILGNNMFAYCRNNPVCRIDISGTADADCYDDDPLDEEDMLKDSQGGGSGQSSGIGFSSFKALKSFLGSAGTGKHWHHIVEQCQTGKSGFSSEQINNTSNVIAVDANTHAKITGYYNTTTFTFTNGLSVRNWLSGQPYAVQYDFGMGVLQQFGVIK